MYTIVLSDELQSGHAPRRCTIIGGMTHVHLATRAAALFAAIASTLLAGPVVAQQTATEDSWAATEIAPGELHTQLAADADAPLVLDVRRPDEFAAGHVPGAVNIPHDQIADRLAELEASKDRPIVAYCGSGRRAAIALAMLHEAGFTRLLHLTGDMPGWERETAAEAEATKAE